MPLFIFQVGPFWSENKNYFENTRAYIFFLWGGYYNKMVLLLGGKIVNIWIISISVISIYAPGQFSIFFLSQYFLKFIAIFFKTTSYLISAPIYSVYFNSNIMISFCESMSSSAEFSSSTPFYLETGCWFRASSQWWRIVQCIFKKKKKNRP